MSVALPFVGSAILLISCSPKEGQGKYVQENIMTMRSDTLTIIDAKNGVVNSRFYTPLVEEYKYAPSPYREFPRGIDIVTYDSLGGIKSTLASNYALFWIDLELWEVKGDVKATNEDGDMLETQQLYWNQKTERVYSNNFTKLTQGEDVLVGEGFESDQDFKEWVFRKPRGVLLVNTEPNRGDSTNLQTTAQDSLPPTTTPPQLEPEQGQEQGAGVEQGQEQGPEVEKQQEQQSEQGPEQGAELGVEQEPELIPEQEQGPEQQPGLGVEKQQEQQPELGVEQQSEQQPEQQPEQHPEQHPEQGQEQGAELDVEKQQEQQPELGVEQQPTPQSAPQPEKQPEKQSAPQQEQQLEPELEQEPDPQSAQPPEQMPVPLQDAGSQPTAAQSDATASHNEDITSADLSDGEDARTFQDAGISQVVSAAVCAVPQNGGNMAECTAGDETATWDLPASEVFADTHGGTGKQLLTRDRVTAVTGGINKGADYTSSASNIAITSTLNPLHGVENWAESARNAGGDDGAAEVCGVPRAPKVEVCGAMNLRLNGVTINIQA